MNPSLPLGGRRSHFYYYLLPHLSYSLVPPPPPPPPPHLPQFTFPYLPYFIRIRVTAKYHRRNETSKIRPYEEKMFSAYGIIYEVDGIIRVKRSTSIWLGWNDEIINSKQIFYSGMLIHHSAYNNIEKIFN